MKQINSSWRKLRPNSMVFAVCVMLLAFTSCGKQDVPTQPITVENETMLTVSPEKFNGLIKDGEHLVIIVKKECRKNDYMDDVDVDGNVQFKVHIYESPRLIKADIVGLAGQRLHTKFCHEYLQVQTRYANGYMGAQQAAYEMMLLMKQAQADAVNNSSKFQRWLSNGVLDAFTEGLVGVSMSLFKPYNNFLGKFVYSIFYLPAYFFVAHSSSAEMLVVKLFTILLAVYLLLLLIEIKVNVKKNYNPRCLRWSMRLQMFRPIFLSYSFILLLIASYFVARPVLENVFVLQDVYHIKTNILDSYYKFHLHSASILMVVIAIISFVCLHYLYINIMTNRVSSGKISEEMAMDVTNDLAKKTGKQMWSLILALILAPFFEQSLILAFLLYVLFVLINMLIIMSKTVVRWICFHQGAWYTIIGALVVIAFIL